MSDDRFAPMVDSGSFRGNAKWLRRLYQRDGYVLIRSILDREKVLDVRRDYFSRFDKRVFAQGTEPGEGIFSGVAPQDLPPYGTRGHPAYECVRDSTFDELTSDPALAAVAEVLLGTAVALLPRRILRHFDNAAHFASRAHVDRDYMQCEDDLATTAWIPLGDCNIDCGGIVYLEGSHRVLPESLDSIRSITDRPEDRRPVSNNLSRTQDALGGRWLWSMFQAGDVVFHAPSVLHASLDNRSSMMRLSADIRFVVDGGQLDSRWLADWSADDGY